jgi:hypothetical protein
MIAEDFVTTGKATPTPEVLHQLLRYDVAYAKASAELHGEFGRLS